MLFLFLACEPTGTTYKGSSLYTYLPLDGAREWSYSLEMDEATAEGYTGLQEIDALKVAEENVNSYTKVTIEYSQDNGVGETGTPLLRITWSSDASNGIAIHGYENLQSGESAVVFDTPVLLAEPQMLKGTTLESATNSGGTVSSNYIGIEPCPNKWTAELDEPWNCAYFEISSDEGLPFDGGWWFATSWGTSLFQIDNGPLSAEYTWSLAKSEWESEFVSPSEEE